LDGAVEKHVRDEPVVRSLEGQRGGTERRPGAASCRRFEREPYPLRDTFQKKRGGGGAV